MRTVKCQDGDRVFYAGKQVMIKSFGIIFHAWPGLVLAKLNKKHYIYAAYFTAWTFVVRFLIVTIFKGTEPGRCRVLF